MNSDQKNILYFLTGRVQSYIRSTLELGCDWTCSGVLSTRFGGEHLVLLNENCPDVSEEYSKGVGSKHSIIRGSLDSVVKTRPRVDLVAIHRNLKYFVDESDLENSASLLAENIDHLKAKYVVVIDNKENPLMENEILKNAFIAKGFQVVSYGLIEKRNKKVEVDDGEKRIFTGYLFYKRRGKGVEKSN